MALRSRSKDALLLVLAVTALVVAFYTFRGHPVPSKVPSVKPSPQAGEKLLTAAEKQVIAFGADPEATMPLTNGVRNPFAAPPGAPPIRIPAPKASRRETEEQPEAPPERVVRRPVVTVPPPLPTYVAVAPAQTGAVQPAGVAPVAPAPPPDRPTLSGIVTDTSGRLSAIIHEGDRRYYAKAGDSIAGKYRVQSISNQEVVLVTADKQRVVLKMGGSE